MAVLVYVLSLFAHISIMNLKKLMDTIGTYDVILFTSVISGKGFKEQNESSVRRI